MAGWKNLKRRLSFTSCCGVQISEPDETERTMSEGGREETAVMNLAMALAAERNSREGSYVGPPAGGEDVKTLMRLIEETDGEDDRRRAMGKKEEEMSEETRGGGGEGGDWVCCVCMEREKGAAFIPCGHTFCRVCSRTLWGRRGCCPVCNRPIVKVLDIF
ncbi:hypothetical protein LINGRAHAP2_LOCUS18899 [Linum grandiflorum]